MTRAEELRQRVAEEAWVPASGMFDRDEVVADILRAIVEELGITEADVDACRSRADVQDAMRDAGDPRYAGITNGWARLATALACLVEAAGDE